MPPDTAFMESTAAGPISMAEFQRMIDTGEIEQDAPVELLEGRIVEKMTKHPPHIKAMVKLTKLVVRTLPEIWHAQFQDSIRLVDSMPEPDCVIVRGSEDDYDRLAEANDLGLVIEVADSSLNKDRRKAATYARAKIPQYWILNLQAECLESYRELSDDKSDTSYKHIETYQRGESVPLVLDGQLIGELSVDSLLP